jgi:DNA-binding CsgD family transcriptional regulator/biotin operon repressor
MTTTEYRQLYSIAVNEAKAARISQATRLKDTGMSVSAIAREMQINESSVRSLLKTTATVKIDRLKSTVDELRAAVKAKKYIDVGAGVEHFMGVSRSQLNSAVKQLETEGYHVRYIKQPQLGTRHETLFKVLVAPGVTYKEVKAHEGEITQVKAWSEDQGTTWQHIVPPTSISSKRVAVSYKEDGGDKADGTIYVRPGVKDISLGGKSYAQVRIAVDGTHYLKGMAVYKDDLPKGVDLQFNTNKSDTGNKLDAMKKMATKPDGTIDMDNPFTSVIRRQQGVMNVVNEEGHWQDWSHTLSSQFLSKQNPKLAKDQLDLMYETHKNNLDEIMSLTNPTLRRVMLEKFADGADSASVHLKAAGLPRTAQHVIMPLKSIKENQIYAPAYKDGETVVLIRHPHGGKFEIPELTVNNKNREGKALLGTSPKDAVGIHFKTAEKLSGADFDGDTVLVIPNNLGKVKTAPTLEGLKGFDPKTQYKKYDGMKVMSEIDKQQKMGDISNLITDMTIQGAPHSEIVRAVRHSMVVIDAVKHELNYKKSYEDNAIKALKVKYQGSADGGAATIVSRAKSQFNVPERAQLVRTDPKTGEKIYKYTGKTYLDPKGNVVERTTRSTKLGEAKDAHTLSSGTAIEAVYADHSNRFKAMANAARKEAVNTKSIPYNTSARAVYVKEHASLKAQLHTAQMNSPLERQAQVIGNALVRARLHADPSLDKDQIKNIKQQALKEARIRTGANAKKTRVEISPAEWNAIQAGAISPSMLHDILLKTDIEQVKQLATPRSHLLMTSAKSARMKSLLASGHTQAQVAEILGVSLTTLKTALKTEKG